MNIASTWLHMVDFFNNPIFVVIGGISTLVTLATICYLGYLFSAGVIPVLYRLGTGLSRRKIAIFATSECEIICESLKNSKIFTEKNIIQIRHDNISLANNATIFLVCWKDFSEKIENIIRIKKYSTPMIVYAPHSSGDIDKSTLDKINNEPNSSVVRFRGRLLNDIITSIITTSYDKIATRHT